MTYEKFKSNIIQLGFEEDDIFENNEKTLIEAANRAIIFLNTNIERKEKYFEYEIPENETSSNYRKLNLEEFEDFEDICHKAPKIDGKAVTDFYYEDNVLFFSNRYKGILTVSYYVEPECIPDNPENNYKIKIKKQLLPMLQFLTANYIWLDDDERKAIDYYNQYSEQLQLYRFNKESNEKINIAVVEGGVAI